MNLWNDKDSNVCQRSWVENVVWIKLARSSVQWRAFAKTVMSLFFMKIGNLCKLRDYAMHLIISRPLR